MIRGCAFAEDDHSVEDPPSEEYLLSVLPKAFGLGVETIANVVEDSDHEERIYRALLNAQDADCRTHIDTKNAEHTRQWGSGAALPDRWRRA